MISLTTRSIYGVPAMLELARQYGQGLLQLRHIAERQNTPLKYLEQIFAALVKAGLVRAVRGMRGGYELSRPADAISLWDILVALEGPGRAATSEHPMLGVLHELCQRAEAQVATVFEISLADVLRREAEAYGPMYFI